MAVEQERESRRLTVVQMCNSNYV